MKEDDYIEFTNQLILKGNETSCPFPEEDYRRFIVKNKLIPFLSDRSGVFPAKLRGIIQSEYAKQRKKTDAQADVFETVCGLLSSRNISFVPVKGFLFSLDVYGDMYRRVTNDIDLIVEETRLQEAVEVLIENGFKLFSFVSDAMDDELTNQKKIFIPWTKHFHEIPLYVDKNGYRLFIELKKTTGAVKDDRIAYFLEHTVTGHFRGLTFEVFDTERSFLNAILNIYVHTEHLDTHGFTCLRDFYDLHFFLNVHQPDWDLVAELAKKTRSVHMVYAVLHYLTELLKDRCHPDAAANIWRFTAFTDESPYIFPDGALVDWGSGNTIARRVAGSYAENGRVIAERYSNRVYSDRNPNGTRPLPGGMRRALPDTDICYSIRRANGFVTITADSPDAGFLNGFQLRFEFIRQTDIPDTPDIVFPVSLERDDSGTVLVTVGDGENTVPLPDAEGTDSYSVSVNIPETRFAGIRDWARVCYDVLYKRRVYRNIYKTEHYDSLFYSFMNDPSVVTLA